MQRRLVLPWLSRPPEPDPAGSFERHKHGGPEYLAIPANDAALPLRQYNLILGKPYPAASNLQFRKRLHHEEELFCSGIAAAHVWATGRCRVIE
jgi:hypothetical protein